MARGGLPGLQAFATTPWRLVQWEAGRWRALPDDHAIGELGLRDGARVQVVGGPDQLPPHPVGLRSSGLPGRLGVVGGLDAGRVVALTAGRHVVGRGDGCVLGHPTVSERHARLDVGVDGSLRLRDTGSRNGTWIDGRGEGGQVTATAWARVGAQLVRWVDGVSDAATAPDGLFHRPPRPAPPPFPAAVPAPRLQGGGATAQALPLAATLGSVATGSVMYAMTGSLLMLVMAGIAALVALASGLVGRRRSRLDIGRAAAANRRALQAFDARAMEAVERQRAALRARHPDPAEVVRRATHGSRRTWERRVDHTDLLRATVGHATRPWRPLIAGGHPLPDPDLAHDATGGATTADTVAARLDAVGRLVDTPVAVDLDGQAVGIVGDRQAALALARWLVLEAATHHGPADVGLTIVVDDRDDALTWDWLKWLPHVDDGHGSRSVSVGGAVLRGLGATLDRPRRLVLFDGVQTMTGIDAPGRAVLRCDGIAGIIIAQREDQLPAACTTVVALHGSDGLASVIDVATGARTEHVLVTGISVDTARDAARGLAGLKDPEHARGRQLPALVPLASLLAGGGHAGVVGDLGDGLVVPLGVGPDGPFVVDLERDGPHALIAGTTGAGKSELLRSLVAGLAATATPERVNFVFIDYKGGSAFDRCAELPHVVGLVTDLDDDLAERALVCLHAELAHRERELRAAGVADLRDHRRLPGVPPIPSLVVCIDEFAALAAELPQFLASLVGIAQRGRSLGVHLVLATQRPAGVVNDDIRANTNLRIALRVQDRQDSLDVIEVADAALLPRERPGRALVRLGPGEVVEVQTALATGVAAGPVDERPAIRPFGLLGTTDERGEARHGAALGAGIGRGGATDLEHMVRRARRDWTGPAPRLPWPPPLPTSLAHDDARLTAVSDQPACRTLLLGLADEPTQQRQVAAGWDPTAGHLAVVGVAGSGTTTALRAIAVAAARSGRHDLWVIDAGRGELADLADLPTCGGVVRATEQERLRRLLARLDQELAARRDRTTAGGLSESGPRALVVLIDGYDHLVAASDGAGEPELDRLLAEGAGVGIHVAVAVARPGALAPRVAASMTQRLVLRLADPHDAAILGAAPLPPDAPAGRAAAVPGNRRVQIARVRDDWRDVVAACPSGVRPDPVKALPRRVGLDQLGSSFRPTEVDRLVVPVGIRGADLAPGVLDLHRREHALVIGPPRSGRSTLLATLAAAALGEAARHQVSLHVVVVAPRGGPLADSAGLGAAGVGAAGLGGRAAAELVDPDGLAARLGAAPGDASWLVLVDDADLLVDDARLNAVMAGLADGVHLVAAARGDVVRSAYGSWLRGLASSRTGVLLDPDPDLDPDLFGVRLPRRPLSPPAQGRGWLVAAGVVDQVQVALPG